MLPTAKCVLGASYYNYIGASCYNTLVARTDGSAGWKTHIYLTAILNINGMIYFINTDNEFNVYFDTNNVYIILLTKTYFN